MNIDQAYSSIRGIFTRLKAYPKSQKQLCDELKVIINYMPSYPKYNHKKVAAYFQGMLDLTVENDVIFLYKIKGAFYGTSESIKKVPSLISYKVALEKGLTTHEEIAQQGGLYLILNKDTQSFVRWY